MSESETRQQEISLQRWPLTIDYDRDQRPPMATTVVEGYLDPVPFYYLGFLFSSDSEISQFLGEVPDRAALLTHYRLHVLPRRWKEVGGLPLSPKPGVISWKPPHSPIRFDGRILVHFVINDPIECDNMDKHKETLAGHIIKALGLPEERCNELKWYYVRDSV
ncbi:hypothetical protein F5878DRAFT_46562 [Lentinula raphanica]|uniref:Uncharacterized protein n=1 Tax=Lentinula raphanica TaxID=153919 RepID=A0AA38PDE6_9AGAR|nr:hypothetical protein F5878DRAFT_46562 [Lentinula raphanica]